jgi:glutaconate CoA-transferase subunit B
MRRATSPSGRIADPRRRGAAPQAEKARAAALLPAQAQGQPVHGGLARALRPRGQGRIDVFFLGGAQIDGEANINLVRAEGRRFPGSFGSAFMYSVVKNVILFREEHSKRVLVPKVEFISAAGNPAALLTAGRSSPGSGRSAASGSRACTSRAKSAPRPGLPTIPGHGAPHAGTQRRGPRPAARAGSKEMSGNYPDFTKRVWGLTA